MLVLPEEVPLEVDELEGEPLCSEELDGDDGDEEGDEGEEDGDDGVLLGDGMLGEGRPEEGVEGELGGGVLLLEAQPAIPSTVAINSTGSRPPFALTGMF